MLCKELLFRTPFINSEHDPFLSQTGHFFKVSLEEMEKANLDIQSCSHVLLGSEVSFDRGMVTTHDFFMLDMSLLEIRGDDCINSCSRKFRGCGCRMRSHNTLSISGFSMSFVGKSP